MGLDVRVLCLNAGSSSLKVALIEEGIATARFGADAAATRDLRGLLELRGVAPPNAIGHRLVHGGPDQTAPLRLTPDARARLD